MTSKNAFFVMAKPDALKRNLLGKIISRFEKKGFDLRSLKNLKPEDIQGVIQEHYGEHKDKSFYDNLIQFSLSGPVCVMVWRGNIEVAKTLVVGPTNPLEAQRGTIRGDYSCTLPENLIHCSDSRESAERELKLWYELIY